MTRDELADAAMKELLNGEHMNEFYATIAAIEKTLGIDLTAIAEGRAAKDVLAERDRQVTAEGWTPEHDDAYSWGQLARAAACYAENAVGEMISASGGYNHWLASDEQYTSSHSTPKGWPWAETWWKPKNPRRDLVKAAALILAEIERLDRAMLAARGE